jgi:hypothetical protein
MGLGDFQLRTDFCARQTFTFFEQVHFAQTLRKFIGGLAQ